MILSLLNVKFFIPRPRPDLTARPHLVERFVAGLDCPLTLISAPAGFGKSTLVSTGIAQHAASAARFDVLAWLALDAADNYSRRFWTYFTGALQAGMDTALPGSGRPLDYLLELLQADPPAPEQAILDGLINTLTGLPSRIVLVLDDYHLVHSAQIHEQMTYLLEHQPPNLHLVISTRADPPLPVSRLRARRQLSEFRSADLRFNAAEVTAFLQGMLGMRLSAAELQTIENSTEGWIAGLQMAGLALQTLLSNPDSEDINARIAEFIASFSGKHVYILDYLADEVFNCQSQEVQAFLLKTSILERLEASLCAAVVQAENPSNVKAILEYLEKSNLFLIQLDHERTWFRYHHLFADLLNARLEQSWPELIPALHLRAAQWYEQKGAVEEAVAHALAAKGWEQAASLMEAHMMEYLESGQLVIILKWIDALPPEILHRRPKLCTEIAWAMAHASQTRRLPALIEMIETAMQRWEAQKSTGASDIALSEPEALRIRGVMAILRAYSLILASHPGQALAQALATLKNYPQTDTRELAWLNWVAGFASRGLGNLEQAGEYFTRAVHISQRASTVWEDMATDLAITYHLRGKLAEAARIFGESIRLADQQGLRVKANISRVEAYLSGVLLEQNHLEEALAHARKGVYYLQWWPSANHISTAYAFLGLVLIATGQVEESAEAIRKAEEEQQKGQMTPFVICLVEAARLRLWLATADWLALERWSAQQTAPGMDETTFTEYQETHLIALARAWIGLGRHTHQVEYFEKAAGLLARLDPSAAAGQRVNARIEINLLLALAQSEAARSSNDKSGAELATLTRSLALGLPEGYTQVYLQEGQPAAALLKAWLNSYGSPVHMAHTDIDPQAVKRLLDLFQPAQPIGPDGPDNPSAPPVQLVEPLTGRERQVLELVALGLSNKAIADRLVVSEGTIKTHVHNLIGKLGAQSRTHLLAKARQLKLI